MAEISSSQCEVFGYVRVRGASDRFVFPILVQRLLQCLINAWVVVRPRGVAPTRQLV